MDEPSPPSSRKSQDKIGKVDLADTPRMSPYRTRSRKNSNLTEENIAMHNDSPRTRSATQRVTRRMSRGSESDIVLTPMPQTTRRTRRSPSIVSGDDVSVTPKKKFSVAQENVVMEEDETAEESKLQLSTPDEMGTSNVNKVDKENINTIVNGVVPEVTVQQKSQEANKVNSVAMEHVSNDDSEKIAKASAKLNINEPVVTNSESDPSNALPSESLKPIVSVSLFIKPVRSHLTQIFIFRPPKSTNQQNYRIRHQ